MPRKVELLLLSHPEDAQACSQLKIELAKIYSEEVDQYTEAKSDFIRSINERITLAG